ncbi:MAG: S24/S26 family peptidase [bacterium]
MDAAVRVSNGKPVHIKEKIKYELLDEVLLRGNEFSFVAEGSSMLPFIPPGTKVTIEKAIPETLRPGDIVLYQSGERICLHRFLRASNRDGETVFHMRGDSQTATETVAADGIVGKLVRLEVKGKLFEAEHIQPKKNEKLFFSWLFLSVSTFEFFQRAQKVCRIPSSSLTSAIGKTFWKLSAHTSRMFLK